MPRLSELARLEWLLSPDLARWCRRGFVAGSLAGSAALVLLLWSPWRASGAANIDGEGQAILAVALGFPLSLLAASLPEGVSWLMGPMLLLSAAATWGVLGAVAATVIALVAYRLREWLRRPAG
jgi:hypothetical protein